MALQRLQRLRWRLQRSPRSPPPFLELSKRHGGSTPSRAQTLATHAAPLPSSLPPSSSSKTSSSLVPSPSSTFPFPEPSTLHTHPPQNDLPHRPSPELHALLHALKSQQLASIREAFFSLTDLLRNADSPDHADAVEQVQQLPGSTFSEILRSLDPQTFPEHDVAHGLSLQIGHTQFIDLRNVVDNFGVRCHHRRMLTGMQALAAVRTAPPSSRLTPADCEVLLRCAGAAVDFSAAIIFWKDLTHPETRTIQTWTELIKARFQTDPQYYQYDRARIINPASDTHTNRQRLPRPALRHLDRIRVTLGREKREPWNRRRDEVDEDIRRLLRNRYKFQSFKSHWIRPLLYGFDINEDLLCAAMVAFARSNSLHAIREFILTPYWGLRIDQDTAAGEVKVSGGIEIPSDSPIRPTARLLNAIVDAYGTTSNIATAMNLLDLVARRYDIAVPRDVWANLLNWTYVCAAGPYQTMRKIAGSWPLNSVKAKDVRLLWDLMTSAPYNFQPTLKEYDIYIKLLITLGSMHSLQDALQTIREKAIPEYRTLVKEYETAVLDELLYNDVEPSPEITHRRKQIQLRKDFARNMIANWFAKILTQSNFYGCPRTDFTLRNFVPDLIEEFDEFFPHRVGFPTSQGTARMFRPYATRLFDWVEEWRDTLPQKEASFKLEDEYETTTNPEYEWPRVKPMRILESKRIPVPRHCDMRVPPTEEDARNWWVELEDDMVL